MCDSRGRHDGQRLFVVLVSRDSDTMRSLLLSGMITGLGVAAMLYAGTLTIAMPAKVSYDP